MVTSRTVRAAQKVSEMEVYNSCDTGGGSKACLVAARTVRAAQKVSREGGAIAVTPAGEARHGCFSHSQGCAEGFTRGRCDSCDIGGCKA